MDKEELEKWKITKKTEAYEGYIKNEIDQDEFQIRLKLLDEIV